MIGADRPLSAVQPIHAFDAQHVRLDPLDRRPERDEEPAEILDVRLAGRVADDRRPRRQAGCHDAVLRGHHACLVEEDLRAPEPVRAHVVNPVHFDPRTERRERVDVRVEAAASDDIASRRRDDSAAEAHQERAGQEERGAHLRAELRVELALPQLRCMDADLVQAGPLDLGADVGEQRQHRVDVPDPRHVSKQNRLARQRAGGEDGQRAVLVPRRGHAPV